MLSGPEEDRRNATKTALNDNLRSTGIVTSTAGSRRLPVGVLGVRPAEQE